MEIQSSRLAARHGPDGAPILLPDQDRRRWDRLLIRRGLHALARAESLPAPIGPYTLQAGIAACHARAATPEETDWARIAALYEVLSRLWASPVVELNRAVAVGMSSGPADGLAIVDRLAAAGQLRDYPQLPAVRGECLPGSAGSNRRVLSSNGRPGSVPTGRNGPCFGGAPPRCDRPTGARLTTRTHRAGGPGGSPGSH